MTRPTLLIADDSADMRWLVRSTLRHDYPDVIEVSDGRQLFWQLMRASFATPLSTGTDLIVIADVCMPGYNGLDVLDAWHDASLDVPIIVITSYPDDAVRTKVAALGAILLPKPFTRRRLREVVEHAAHDVRRARWGA